ncbi:hypothetical protein PAMP_012586 [Pampus punctatissimus]
MCLAYTLGIAVPIYVNSEERGLAFIINLQTIVSENKYRLNMSSMLDSGRETRDKVQTPLVVAYHDNSPDLYLAPSLRMCTLTKDIHYLYPSKPFIRDSTEGICGLKSMVPDSKP